MHLLHLALRMCHMSKYGRFAFRLSSSVSTIVPRASSATALEVSNDVNLCYGLSSNVVFLLFLFVFGDNFGYWTGVTGWKTKWKL